jgi:hypothetical protein
VVAYTEHSATKKKLLRKRGDNKVDGTQSVYRVIETSQSPQTSEEKCTCSVPTNINLSYKYQIRCASPDLAALKLSSTIVVLVLQNTTIYILDTMFSLAVFWSTSTTIVLESFKAARSGDAHRI